jgi:caa(3)-type oxidase subunit IV
MTAHPAVSTRLYWIIWGWLAGLMLLGVVLSELNLLPISRGGIIGLVVLLSTVKAGLVALYYMHLKMDRRLLAFIALGPLLLIALALGVIWSSTFIKI